MGGSIGGGFLGRRRRGGEGVVGGRFVVLRGGGRLGAGDRLEFIHTSPLIKELSIREENIQTRNS